jgi:hypothetical protein
VQVQRWLGHHSASFTHDTYTHLLDDGVGDGLDLDAELNLGTPKTKTSRLPTVDVPTAPGLGEPVCGEVAWRGRMAPERAQLQGGTK